MGTYLSPNQRLTYVPPLDRFDDSSGGTSSNAGTFLGGALPAANDWISALAGRLQPAIGRAPNFVPANAPGEDVQIAQQPRPQTLSHDEDGATVEPPPGSPTYNTAQRELDGLVPRRGTAPIVEPTPETPEFQQGMTKAVGHPVILPDGSRVPTSNSDTGYLMSPVPDLRPVAAAGRQVGEVHRRLLENSETAEGAGAYLIGALGAHLGHGGVFDYQREGYSIPGFTHYPHFRDVSNFNVGLFCQQAGMSLDHTLRVAGQFARLRSSNADPAQPYGLDVRQAEFIKKGFQTGESGAFDLPPPR